MNLKRTTIIFVSGAAVAAWLSAAVSPGRPPLTSAAIAPAPLDASGAALASEVSRLAARLRPGPAPREASRNPFAFRSSRSASSSTPSAARRFANDVAVTAASGLAEGADAGAGARDSAVGPQLTLAGVAEDPGTAGGSPVRTAIISGSGPLVLAREGDSVVDRSVTYTVGTISADAVDLIDARDGAVRRLRLK
jgi:hypothetical protein